MRILYALDLPIDELRNIGNGRDFLKNNHHHFLFPLFSFYYERGDELVIVSSNRHIRETEVYEQPRLKVIIVKLWSHGRLSAFDHFRTDIDHIRKAIQYENCDVYHAHWCYEYAMACLLAYPEKTLITLHDWPDIVCPAIGNYYWRKKNRLGNQVLERGQNFTAVSPYIGTMLERKHPGKQIRIVPNFMEETEWKQLRSLRKEECGLIRFLGVNNGFNDIKNTKVAITAFAKLYEERKDICLDLYGDDYEECGSAYRWAKEQHLDVTGIHFHGRAPRDVIYQAFVNADILIHTSIEESFGLIYLEAMASRTVIVAGEQSGATSWVLGPDLARGLTDIRDIQSVFERIKALAEDSETRVQLQECGLRNMQTRFILPAVKDRLDNLYQ